jgi:predicted MFS family arabinose efflux permease
MVVSLLLFAWADSFGFAVAAYWVFATMRGTSGPLYTAWVNQKLDSKVRATVISMSSQVDALGQTLGGPVIGVIGSALSIRAALSASALILSPALAVLGRTIRHGDERIELQPAELASIETME